MKATSLFKGMSVMLGVAMLGSLLFFGLGVQPAAAGAWSMAGGTDKVLVEGLQPGWTVAAYEGALPAINPGGMQLESATPAPIDGKVLELFVPVGKTSTIYLINPQGQYLYLGQVAPQSAFDNISFSAGQAQPVQ
jgi:hypothetical protein